MSLNYFETLRGKLDGKPNYEKFKLLEIAGISFEEMKTLYPTELKTFSDLVFKPHPNNYFFDESSVRAYIEFDNGHWVSVVGGNKNSGLRGNGLSTFELGYPLDDDHIDIFSYLSIEQVTIEMIKIQMKEPFKNE